MGWRVAVVGALWMLGCEDPQATLRVTGVAPDRSPEGVRTPIEVLGAGFAPRVHVSFTDDSSSVVEPMFSVRIGVEDAGSVQLIADGVLRTESPPNLAPGVYDVLVADGMGRQAALTAGFTVLASSAICGLPTTVDGTPCDDLDACTRADVCTSGACVGTVPAEVCFNGVDDDCDPTTSDVPTCGDSKMECGEACDDGDQDDCTAACDATCTGPGPNRCGDNQARCGEQCDGADTGDCTDAGFALPGVLACTSCTFDITGCACDPMLDTDTDMDGMCDALDTDDDEDGCLDVEDIDPLNPPVRAYRALSILAVMEDQDRLDGQMDLDLSVSDAAVVQIIQNAGHGLTFFEETNGGCTPANDSQPPFDAALMMGPFDVIYISESCTTDDVINGASNDPTAPTYLNAAATGIVNNDDALWDNLFLGDNEGTDSVTDIDITNTSHFITSFWPAPGPITLLGSASATSWLDDAGNLAPGLTHLGTLPAAANKRTMVVVDTGGGLLNAAIAPARRVGFPVFRSDRWNVFGTTLFLRSLLWAAGEDAVVPELDADARPSHCDNCPDVYNPSQADADGDGRGDACD